MHVDHQTKKLMLLGAILAVIFSILVLLLPLPVIATESRSEYFDQAWEQADGAVASGQMVRPWMWGPSPEGHGSEMEPYAQAPDNFRLVQYFDKGRMEITNPNGDPNDPWYITNGLLVIEMMTGRIKTGDNQDQFLTRSPAQVNIAGDLGTPSLTFADMRRYATTSEGENVADNLVGVKDVIIDQFLYSGGGHPIQEAPPVVMGYAHYEPKTGHNVADVFWAYMNSASSGLSNNDLGSYLSVLGYPITEAYWTPVRIAGERVTVLVQCFERRCLTYNHTNSAIWQVEMGNTGLSYRLWNNPPTNDSPAFSPDGRMLAFKSNDQVNDEIFVVNLDDMSVNNVTNTPWNEVTPSWQSDTELAFESTIGTKIVDVTTGTTRNSNLYRPVMSPDGTMRAYLLRAQNRYAIWVNGQDFKLEVERGYLYVHSIKWAPDGTHIAYVADVLNADGTVHTGVYVAGIDGSGPFVFHDGNGTTARGYAWDPDSSRVAISLYERLCYYHLNYVEPRCLGNEVYEFDVSPTTGELVFTDRHGVVHLSRSDGSSSNPVSLMGLNESPIWSPDGGAIAFTQKDLTTGGYKLFVDKLDGQGPQLIVP
jgi:Tol biopolymer transport system component